MTKYEVIGIGNAVVDVISQCEDSFLSREGIEKGVMQLIEADRGVAIYEAMENRLQASGGSVANTIAGIGALGLKAGFIGRVSDDELGHFYAAGMAESGTDFVNKPITGATLPTSRSMILVTPDGERSMNTYLGISTELGPEDVDDKIAGSAGLLFLEGYLFDKERGKAAFHAAARACRGNGGRAGISLSDPFCVDRHRNDFRKLARDLDFVLGNEEEWLSLYQTNDLGSALEQAAEESGLIVCTRSGHDVVIAKSDETVTVPVTAVKPVDTTGAGDQFAAGFLYGLATGTTLEVAGLMGCAAAAEVIGHMGARPESDVMAIFKQKGLV